MRTVVQILRKIRGVVGWLKLPEDIWGLLRAALKSIWPWGSVLLSWFLGWLREAPYEQIAVFSILAFVVVYCFVFVSGILRQRGVFDKRTEPRQSEEAQELETQERPPGQPQDQGGNVTAESSRRFNAKVRQKSLNYYMDEAEALRAENEQLRRTVGEQGQTHGGEPEESQRRVDNRFVTSHNQMGGQTAWWINNQGPQPRRISQAAGDALIEELRKHPPETFQISWMQDTESGELGAVLQDILQKGGWQMTMQVSGAMLSGGPPRGVFVETTVDSEALNAVVRWLRSAGLEPQVNRSEQRFGILTRSPVPIHVVVGVLPQ